MRSEEKRHGIRKTALYEERGRFYDWDTGHEVRGPVDPTLVTISEERGAYVMWTWLEDGERAWASLRPPRQYEELIPEQKVRTPWGLETRRQR